MREMEKTELMNLCMIYDGEGNVLLQNRRKKGLARRYLSGRTRGKGRVLGAFGYPGDKGGNRIGNPQCEALRGERVVR